MLALKNPMEAMKIRKSVRTYDGLPMKAEDVLSVVDFMDKQACVFNGIVRFTTIQMDSTEGVKLGTYGVIKGAKTFIVAIAKNSPQDMEKLGFLLEKGVLLATEQGWGTCWLAGTYKLNDFQGVVLKDTEEKIIAITPIGKPAEKSHFMDRTMRKLAGSDSRKPFESMFFNETYGEPLRINNFNSEALGNPYIQALEMVRLGPSASNKQPWRVIKTGQDYHFYLERTKKYPIQFQRIDMGIAVAHFDLAIKASGLNGEWEFNNPEIEIPEHVIYCVSWKWIE